MFFKPLAPPTRVVAALLLLTSLGLLPATPARAEGATEPAAEILAAPEPATETATLPTVPGSDFWALDPGKGAVQRGKASWYGKRFHGRRTASGEIFRMSDRTAAHRTLPLLSYAKVTLLSTGKSVIVRINDRGPHILTHRVIDLSEAAARDLGLLALGTADVLVERVVQLPSAGDTEPGLGLRN